MAEDIKLMWSGIAFKEDQEAANKTGTRPPTGIFGEVPASTPKYARQNGEERRDFREQMARLFIQVPDYTKFVAEFNNAPESQQIAKVLGGTITKDGNTNASGTEGNGYVDFLLQNVQHSFQEKSQVVEMLADEHVAYFFGQGAPVFTYSGTLINTRQDDQAINMLRLYRDMGRGSMLAMRNTLISIRYDGLIVSGAMTGLSMGLNAEMEMAVPFNFSLLVKQVLPLPNDKFGLVRLSEPFAVAKDGYRPFDQGAAQFDTSSVKVVMAPPSAPIPAANQGLEKKEDTAEAEKKLQAVKTLQAQTVPKSDAELEAEAQARRQNERNTTRRYDLGKI
jgi:hypothetical protein